MISLLLFDFARVILFPRHETLSALGSLYSQSSDEDMFMLNDELLQFIKAKKAEYKTAILTNSASILNEGSPYRVQMDAYFHEIFLSKELPRLVTLFNLSLLHPNKWCGPLLFDKRLPIGLRQYLELVRLM